MWWRDLASTIENNGGCRTIYRTEDGVRRLYLKRYYIFRSATTEIMLHQFFLGDQGPLHDHPWDSENKILETGYIEILPEGRFLREPGYHGSRPAESFHKVELMPGTEGNVWTLFTTGPRRRKWGFNDNGTWIPFDQYSGNVGNVQPEQYSMGLFPRKVD